MFRSPRDVGLVPPVKVNDNPYEKIEVELYGCDMCHDGGWTSETEVEIHKTKVHYKKAFMNKLKKRNDYCFICIKQCADKESVVKHIKSEHLLSTETCLRVEREIFICDECSAIFFNKDNLIIHLRYAHLDMSQMDLIKCLICHRNIQVRNMPAHFYMHNIQSVSTCRICLCKCLNTKALKQHLRLHPYYLKCDMCYYDTTRVESFQSHILARHKTSAKNKDPTTDDKELMTVDNPAAKNLMTVDTVTKIEHDETDQNLMIEDVKSENLIESDTLVEGDFLTVIEISDMDTVTDMMTIKNLMAGEALISKSEDRRAEEEEEVLMTGVKRSKRKLKGIKRKTKKKKGMSTEIVTALTDVMNDFVVQTNDEDLLNENPVGNYDTNLMILPDLMTDDIKDPDLITTGVRSENNIMSLFESSDKEIAVTSKNFMTGDTIKEELTDHSDLMTDEVMSDSNLMTVIEISDHGLSTDNIDDKSSKIADTKLTDAEKTVKDSMSNNEIDNFKRYFIPETPSYLRLQSIAGVRGIRLSNDVHICILCREVCVGLEEMRLHINEHAVKKEKINHYECTCGEKFTNKVLLKYHAFKSKHNI
ncbi:uncharacterized protein LOC123879347 isoform X2 [Maniola jurtina]|uniref:uncharacterized protein LOC123879347 isoform X2 n=1 Tax=Maniola jurtina TaxID=191418 RepID=UPI001E68DA25|nr:uncharacterized protein LOC123879347 isoform X2 [Maniola jurtina]